MSEDHATQSEDLLVKLQDGSLITLRRDDQDHLFVAACDPHAGSPTDGLTFEAGYRVLGFGPWPTWSANTTTATATLPDEESGIFEPERLFVLREQYLFLALADAPAHIVSVGPIHKVWWAGTEHVVQARRIGTRH